MPFQQREDGNIQNGDESPKRPSEEEDTQSSSPVPPIAKIEKSELNPTFDHAESDTNTEEQETEGETEEETEGECETIPMDICQSDGEELTSLSGGIEEVEETGSEDERRRRHELDICAQMNFSSGRFAAANANAPAIDRMDWQSKSHLITRFSALRIGPLFTDGGSTPHRQMLCAEQFAGCHYAPNAISMSYCHAVVMDDIHIDDGKMVVGAEVTVSQTVQLANGDGNMDAERTKSLPVVGHATVDFSTDVKKVSVAPVKQELQVGGK